MPELPEVDKICMIVRRYAVGMSLTSVEVLRGKNYFGGISFDYDSSDGSVVTDVYRVGKHIMFRMGVCGYIQAHMAMTGYFDWEHEPWTFDYVEGAREPAKTSDIRVRMTFRRAYDKGVVEKVLRLHDARLFGRIGWAGEHPTGGPELMRTPAGFDRPIITLQDFAHGLWHSTKPIKQLLMDQSFLAGIGNIYANEACHVVGVDPRWPACSVPPAMVPLLLEALRCVVGHCIPTITYTWLKVYRRTTCGTCSGPVIRTEIAKRATFICERCQGIPHA